MWDAMAGAGAFVALGDSFTEGIGDPYPDGSGYRGWADRFAERLAVGRPGLRYANLAIRGRLLREVADDQVPRAVAMAPDLVFVGLPVDEDWREPFPPATVPARHRATAWLAARRADARWAREHAAPWVARRLRGVSTGDGVPPKRPELLPLFPQAL